jgi:hypothetical protein
MMSPHFAYSNLVHDSCFNIIHNMSAGVYIVLDKAQQRPHAMQGIMILVGPLRPMCISRSTRAN